MMKAVILAAGKGTRMRELTSDIPKPMLRVRGRPILEHIIDALRNSGVQDVFIITGYRGEAIREHFADGARSGVRVQYGHQAVQDGTGKAPELARDFAGDSPFLLTYGDILVRPETYPRLIARFSSGAFAAAVTVTGSEDVTKGGLFFFDPDFCLAHLVEKPLPDEVARLRADGWLKPGATAWYNAGIYVFRPLLFDYTARLEKSSRGEYELTDALRGMIADGHRIAGMEIEGRWVDVRDPAVLAALERGEGG